VANEINILVKLQDLATTGLKNVQSGLASLGNAAKDAESKSKDLGKQLESLGNVGKTLAVGAGVVAGALGLMGSAALKAAGQWEQLQTQFRVMIGDTQKADQVLEDLKKTAATTPFELEDLAKGGQTLLAFGIQSEKLIPTLRMLGDVAGGNKDKFNSLTLAFGQMSSTGRLMGQDLLQMINAGFNPLKVISDKTGISMADLKKKMEAGAISADMVTEAFQIATSKGGQFYGMMEKQSQTLEGKLSTLRDSFAEVSRQIGQALLPAVKLLVDVFTTLVNWFAALPQPIKSVVAIGGALVFVLATLLTIFGGFLTILPAMVAGWTLLTGAVTAFGISLNIATLGIPALIAGFIILIANIKKIADFFNGLPLIFKAAFLPLLLLINTIKIAVDGVMKLVDAISKIPAVKKLFESNKKTSDTTSTTTANTQTNKTNNVSTFSALGSGGQAVDLQKDLKDFEANQKNKTTIAQQEIAKRTVLELQANATKQEIDALQAEMELAKTEEKLANLDAFYEAEKIKYAGNKDALAELDVLYAEQKLKLEEDRIAQTDAVKDAEYLRDKQRMTGGLQEFVNMLDIKKKMTKSQAQDFANWQSFMAGAEQSKNKEVAAIAKAMAIYDIGLKTANAAISAYSSLAGIPIFGPALGIGAAAAAMAYGTEQASKVASMQPALAEGGMVRSQVGGQSVTVAEGGKDEAVVPLDDPNTAQRIQQAAGSGGQQVVQLVVDGVVLAETVVQGYNKGINIGTVTRLK